MVHIDQIRALPQPKRIKSLDEVAWEMVKPVILKAIAAKEQENRELEIKIEQTRDLKAKKEMLQVYEDNEKTITKFHTEHRVLNFLLDFFRNKPEFAYYVIPKSYMALPQIDGINTDDVVNFMNERQKEYNFFKHYVLMQRFA